MFVIINFEIYVKIARVQSVNIRTTQNVAIDYEIASLGDRILAFLIDGVIQAVYMITVFWILIKLDINSNWVATAFYLPAFFYHLVCEISFNGQSFGKKQMNIKVVRLDGTPPTIGGYIFRWIVRPIDITLFSGGLAVLFIAITDNSQRLGDLAAGTSVVKVAKEIKVTSHQLINNLTSDYQPLFPEVTQLGEKEIAIIKDALKANKEHANIKPVLAVTAKVKEHLNVETDMPAIKFLYTILKDYSHYTSQ